MFIMFMYKCGVWSATGPGHRHDTANLQLDSLSDKDTTRFVNKNRYAPYLASVYVNVGIINCAISTASAIKLYP